MRTRFVALALFATVGTVGAADIPAPLVKPVTPTGTGVRVRVPVAEDKGTFMQFKAQIPKLQGKKGEMIDVKVALDTLSYMGKVNSKRWKAWGFEVPANGAGVLPELVIPAGQLAPKPAQGRDVELRLVNMKLLVVEPPGGQDEFEGCDFALSLRDLTGGADRAFEPRVYFADRFLELTAPGGAIKKLNTGDAPAPDPARPRGELVPALGTLNAAAPATFAFASVNGLTRYTTPTGKGETVNVAVAVLANYPEPGIVMSVNTARGCGVVLEKQPGDGELVPGKVKELRLGFLVGPGFKGQKDFVLKDVTVHVVDGKSQAFVLLGPRFVEKHFTDGVYGCGSDGVWRLHGRVKAEFFEDSKTRMPPKKP
jgi:hypothetical protein